MTRKTRKHHLPENERVLLVLHIAIREEMCTVPNNAAPVIWAMICRQKFVFKARLKPSSFRATLFRLKPASHACSPVIFSVLVKVMKDWNKPRFSVCSKKLPPCVKWNVVKIYSDTRKQTRDRAEDKWRCLHTLFRTVLTSQTLVVSRREEPSTAVLLRT